MLNTSFSLTRTSFPLPILPLDVSRCSKCPWTCAQSCQSITCVDGSRADSGYLLMSSNGKRSLVEMTMRDIICTSGRWSGRRLPAIAVGKLNVKPTSFCNAPTAGYMSTIICVSNAKIIPKLRVSTHTWKGESFDITE